MKKQAVIIASTVAITVMVVIVGFILLMPVIGPRYLHPLMSQSMPMHMNNAAPGELDTSTELPTDSGLYRVSFTSNLDPISINQMHTWTLHVETTDGQIVEDAVILVDGGMPQHGHGLPTRPQVTQYLGNGDYLVEGLKFQMGGWWEVKFNIRADGQSDNVTFNLVLEGG
ncbi:MAG: FixH family protein [Chloroflexota bacterium]